MQPRLPQPGQDNGTWGTILNQFLQQAHNADGSLKTLTQDQVSGLVSDMAAKVGTTDARLTDQRTPTDNSVTNAKVSGTAAISADKLADGTTNKVMTATERTKLSGLATVATSGSYTDLTSKPTIPDPATLVANADLDTKTNALVTNAGSATAVSLRAAFAPTSLINIRRLASRPITVISSSVVTVADVSSHGITGAVGIPATVAENPYMTKCAGGSFSDIRIWSHHSWTPEPRYDHTMSVRNRVLVLRDNRGNPYLFCSW